MHSMTKSLLVFQMYSGKAIELHNMTRDPLNTSAQWASRESTLFEAALSQQYSHNHNSNNNNSTLCGDGYHRRMAGGEGGSEEGCWTEQSEAAMTTTEVTLLATILVAVFLASVVANVLVCVVFSKRRCSLSLSNRFLANLTLCNCLFTFLVMPFAFVSLVSRRWLFGPVLCQCTGLAMNLLVTASIFTLAVVSLDRYCAVVTPLHYTLRMTRRRCWAFIAGIWLASLGVSFPPLLGWNSFKFHVNKMICTVAWASPRAGDRYYTLFLVSISFVLPLVAMLWTYSCIFRAARDNSERTRRSSIVPTVQADSDPAQATPINKRRRSSSVPIIRRLSQTSSRSNSILQRREEWKTAVTSFLILFSFMLCWLPYFIVICIRSLAPSLQLHPVMSTISTVAAMFGCACNPMVYVFRSKGTRHDLKVILTRRRSFRNEAVQSIRRGGSMRSDRSDKSETTRGEREKGSVFWHEDMFSHGECHSIQEESDPPCEDTCSGTTTQSVTVATPQMLRSSPSLQQC